MTADTQSFYTYTDHPDLLIDRTQDKDQYMKQTQRLPVQTSDIAAHR